jgi:nicotinate-nucleotide adenylyltransferase
MAPFAERFAGAVAMARHPRVLVSDLERRMGTQFTADTLAQLRRRYPRVSFVWLMGADNLGQIHRWQDWRSIFATVPVAVFDRPPNGLKTRVASAARAYRRGWVRPSAARSLARRAAPAWTFFPSRLEPLSATQIRLAGPGFPSPRVAESRRPPYVQEGSIHPRGTP